VITPLKSMNSWTALRTPKNGPSCAQSNASTNMRHVRRRGNRTKSTYGTRKRWALRRGSVFAGDETASRPGRRRISTRGQTERLRENFLRSAAYSGSYGCSSLPWNAIASKSINRRCAVFTSQCVPEISFAGKTGESRTKPSRSPPSAWIEIA